MKNIPKALLSSKYRKDLWQEVSAVVKQVEKTVPISQMYVMGSFLTKKRRPADIDFLVLVKTKKGSRRNWSADFVITPDNAHGEAVLKDAQKWMKQKYGAKNSGFIRLK